MIEEEKNSIPKRPFISLKGVKKSFFRKKVLDGVDLTVDKGESVVIIGSSGTGKSVLLKCILGLMPYDDGSIIVDGVEINQASNKERLDINKKISMLFQEGALFDSLPVWENVAFGLRMSYNMGKKQAYEQAILNLQKVGLSPDVALQYPAELSGGMTKRVALARAICTNPQAIFFDEPTTGLDPIMADVINDLIIMTSKELGSASLSITHDMHSALKIADKIAMLWQGKIIWVGTPQQLKDTDNELVQQFYKGTSTKVFENSLR